MIDLNGKNILIIGASSGIGAEIARKVAEQVLRPSLLHAGKRNLRMYVDQSVMIKRFSILPIFLIVMQLKV